jgi:hypothetical protein
MGSTVGNLEPCLFVKQGVICLVYVDDCLFFGRDKNKIRELVQEIQDTGFELTIEEDVYAFLGVEVKFDSESGTVTLTQTGLLKKINSKAAPADSSPLRPGTDADLPHVESWQYASLIGCLSYLGNNTRPDIQYAVHACTQYTHRPKAFH